jgi:nucleotide-binding universal stress UspA family protein
METMDRLSRSVAFHEVGGAGNPDASPAGRPSAFRSVAATVEARPALPPSSGPRATPQPAASGSATIATILLATDLEPTSADAVRVAIELAARLSARLVVLNAYDVNRLGGAGRHQRLDQARAEREPRLLEIVREARSAGAAAEYLLWPGDPVPGIRAVADAEGADLIVVGSHGRDRAGRLLLGSVSDALVRTADCPVLVARPRAHAPAGAQ